MKERDLGEQALAVELAPGLFRIRNRTFSSNTYLYKVSEAGECVVIDPGLDPGLIDKVITTCGFKPVAVLCTHGHFDHVGSADVLRKKYGIAMHLHLADEMIMKSSNFLMKMCHIDCQIPTPTVDVFAENEAVYTVGDHEARYHHMPGHTPGSCFISLGGALFTGDSLYRDSISLVKLPGENAEELKGSLSRAWNLFSDDTLVCPGHGGAGLFGAIKQNNGPLLTFLGKANP